MKNKKLLIIPIVLVIIPLVIWLGSQFLQNFDFYGAGDYHQAESYEEFMEIMSEANMPLPAEEDFPSNVTYHYAYHEVGISAEPCVYFIWGESNSMRFIVHRIVETHVNFPTYTTIQYNGTLDGIPVSYSEGHIQFVWDGYFYSFHYNDVMSQEKAEEILIMLVNGGV